MEVACDLCRVFVRVTASDPPKVRDSDMAVAWAKDNGDRGPPRAGWHVFSGSAGDFLLDTSMAVT